MSITYQELDELFDELVKRTAESRRKDDINFDVEDIRNILFKIYDNTSNVEDTNKKELDDLDKELKSNQKDREERQNKVKIGKRQNPKRERERNHSSTFEHSMGKFFDFLTHHHNLLFSGIDKRSDTWQQMYSAGGAWNGDFLKLSSDINKNGMTLEEALKNFRESGFSGHLFGASEFTELSGKVRQAARDLGDIGIPTSEYNKQISNFVDNLKENNDLQGRSTTDLTNQFTNLIKEAGSLSASFGQTIDEFMKARNKIAEDPLTKLAMSRVPQSGRESVNTLGAAFSKAIPEQMFQQLIASAMNHGAMTPELAKYIPTLGADSLHGMITAIQRTSRLNPHDSHYNEELNNVIKQFYSAAQGGIHHYHQSEVNTGISTVAGLGVVDPRFTQSMEAIQNLEQNLPSISEFRKRMANNNAPDEVTRSANRLNPAREQNEAKKENITSTAMAAVPNTIMGIEDTRKEVLDKVGGIYDDISKLANHLPVLDSSLSTIIQLLKDQAVEIGVLATLSAPALKGMLQLIGKRSAAHMFRSAASHGLHSASYINTGSILSGGTGGYRSFSNGYSVSGKLSESGSILYGATETPTTIRSFLKDMLIGESRMPLLMRSMGIFGTGLTAGLTGYNIYKSKQKEEEEKLLHPEQSREIHNRESEYRWGQGGNAVGGLAGATAGAKLGLRLASHIPFVPLPAKLAIGSIGGGVVGAIGGSLGGDAGLRLLAKADNALNDFGKSDKDSSERKHNQEMFSQITHPFTSAINGMLTGSAIGGGIGAMAGGVGAAPGSIIGGGLGGLTGLGYGLTHNDKSEADNVVGRTLGNWFTDVEDWWNKPKPSDEKKTEEKPKDDSISNTSDLSHPNNESIISTHYHQDVKQEHDGVDEINENLRKLIDTFQSNMKIQTDLLNKLNNSSRDNGSYIKNNSPSI